MGEIDAKIGFIGVGNMGGALIAGITEGGLTNPENIYVSDHNQDVVRETVKKYGVGSAANKAVASVCDLCFIVVKLDGAEEVLNEIKPHLKRGSVVISIVAGFTIRRMEEILKGAAKVVRVMPNTPVKVRAGMCALARGKGVTDEEADFILNLLSGVGRAREITEDKMDAVTGVSGSSPAFIFQIAEAMSDAGVMAGLKREEALEMSAQAILGAAKMILETGLHPGILKDMVTSPGGTTIAGVYEMEKMGARAALMSAVTAAVNKSREMSGK